MIRTAKKGAQNLNSTMYWRYRYTVIFFKSHPMLPLKTHSTKLEIYSDCCVVWSRMFYWQRYKLSGPFRYLKRFIKFTGNFLEAFEKKSQLKTENFVRIFLADVELHFSKYQFSRFSWYILCSVCCMVMIFYWRKDMSSTDVPDTLDLYMKLTKKFLGIFEKVWA